MDTRMFMETLLEHAATAHKYEERALENGSFLGMTAEYWRGAAVTYGTIADALEEEVTRPRTMVTATEGLRHSEDDACEALGCKEVSRGNDML